MLSAGEGRRSCRQAWHAFKAPRIADWGTNMGCWWQICPYLQSLMWLDDMRLSEAVLQGDTGNCLLLKGVGTKLIG